MSSNPFLADIPIMSFDLDAFEDAEPQVVSETIVRTTDVPPPSSEATKQQFSSQRPEKTTTEEGSFSTDSSKLKKNRKKRVRQAEPPKVISEDPPQTIEEENEPSSAKPKASETDTPSKKNTSPTKQPSLKKAKSGASLSRGKGNDTSATATGTLPSVLPVSDPTGGNGKEPAGGSSLALGPQNPPSKKSTKDLLSLGLKSDFSYHYPGGKPICYSPGCSQDLFDLIGGRSDSAPQLSSPDRKNLRAKAAQSHLQAAALFGRLLSDSEAKLSEASASSKAMIDSLSSLKNQYLRAEAELKEAKEHARIALKQFEEANEKVMVLSSRVGNLEGQLESVSSEKDLLTQKVFELSKEKDQLEAGLLVGKPVETEGIDKGKLDRLQSYIKGRRLLDPIINSHGQVHAQIKLLDQLKKKGVAIPESMIENYEVKAARHLRNFAALPAPFLHPSDMIAPNVSRPWSDPPVFRRSDDRVAELAPGVIDQFGSNIQMMSEVVREL